MSPIPRNPQTSKEKTNKTSGLVEASSEGKGGPTNAPLTRASIMHLMR